MDCQWLIRQPVPARRLFAFFVALSSVCVAEVALGTEVAAADTAETFSTGGSPGEPQPRQEPSAPSRHGVRPPELAAGTRGPHWAPAVVETLSLLTAMRVTEGILWPDPFSFRQIDRWPDRYERAFTQPPKFDLSRPWFEWDGDRWYINGVGHSLLGSELYLRPRRCGFGWLGSLGYATAASTLWEYGFEANGVRPSGLDLWFTPLSGLLLGEGRYQAWQAAGDISEPTVRLLIRSILDPIGEFSSNVFGAPC
jgi:hypothetical protein